MKARIIKEIANVNRRSSIYKLGSNIKFENPLIIFITPETSTLSIHDNFENRMDKFINRERIPSYFEILHIDSDVHTGVIYSDPFTLVGRVYIDNDKLPLFRKTFFKSTIEVLTSKNVDVRQSIHRIDSNDIVFTKDSKDKKFCGCLMNVKESYFSFIITLKFDSEKLDGIFKLDTDKFKTRGDINTISDVVGGLNEVLPNVNKDIVDEIFQSIANKLNWEIEETSFTDEEESILVNL